MPTSMRWINYGVEHQYVNEAGIVQAKVTKNGCCWYASLGEYPMSNGRFSRLDDAKYIVEKLLKPSEVPVGN